MKKKRKFNAWVFPLVLVALPVAICAAVLTHSWAVDPEAEASPTPEPTPLAEAVIAPPEATPVPEVAAEEPERPQVVARYADLTLTEAEREELVAIIYLESANQSAEGQQAVAEVILNRAASPAFPDSIHDVLHQGEGTLTPQFSTIGSLHSAEPGQVQYDAVTAAFYGPPVLPADVLYFSRGGENDRIWGAIGDHVFCYGYDWE